MNRAKFEKSSEAEFANAYTVVHLLTLSIGYIGVLQVLRADIINQHEDMEKRLCDTSLSAYDRAKGEVTIQINRDMKQILDDAIGQCMKAREASMDEYEAVVEPLSPQYATVKSH